MHIVHDFHMVDSMLETEQEHKLKSVVIRKEETKRPILPNRLRDPFTRSTAQNEDQRAVMNVDKMPLSELLPILKSKTFYQHPKPISTLNAHTRDQSKWCEYHNAAGHITDRCFTLCQYVNHFRKEGYLNDISHFQTGRID